MAEQAKSIFITGAASGLGREVARYFANVGWFVGLADVDEGGLVETANMLPPGMWSMHRLDVTDRAQWKQAVADFAQHTDGHMTVLFNNAGIGSGGPIQEMTDEAIDKMIAVNLTGVISGTRACFDLLKNTPDACVLYTSSAAGIYGSAGLSVYSARAGHQIAQPDARIYRYKHYRQRRRDRKQHDRQGTVAIGRA
jgi:NADP-dependent 3-hydroxy acid dehydrogenase YdfG